MTIPPGPAASAGHLTRRRFLAGSAAAALAAGLPLPALAGGHRRCATDPSAATDWVRVLYDVVMAEGLTPPAAARFYHYAAVAMHESTLAAMPHHRSLAGRLAGLERGPIARGRIDAPVALSAAVVAVAAGLLPNALASSREALAAHHAELTGVRRATVRAEVVDAGLVHGEQMAGHVLAWASADGYAEASGLPYVPPVGPDLWRSTPPNYGTAIEPHWRLVRPSILRAADEVAPTPHLPFSTEIGSPFHDQAMATYRQSFENTDEQIAIARFWTDNPRLSGLPAGHWFLLLAQLAVEPLGLGLDDAVDGFARLGVALHDAFTNCWTWKYRFNLVRPVSYVRDHIDPAWNTLVNTPQFPEYTSGHSVASGAAEVVLTDRFGSFAFTDSTGVPRKLAPRTFASFGAAAAEAAQSRLYGGIHYPMGIEHGLVQGRRIGRLVVRRLR